MKSFIKKLLGDRWVGAIAYYLRPHYRYYCGGPFNNQEFRKQIFLDLIRNIDFSTVIETGTYLGTTTEYLHQTSHLPVHTVETNDRYFGFSQARFLMNRSIRISHDDSRSFLRRIVSDPALHDKRVFFYLDAHWSEDLPLKEELITIFNAIRDAVVMVDDFNVPGDDGYGFDGYGQGKVLNLDYIEPARAQLGLAVYFPSKSSSEETGQKRGCVILAKSPALIEILGRLDTITVHRK